MVEVFLRHFMRTFYVLDTSLNGVPFCSLRCKHPTEISCIQYVTTEELWGQGGTSSVRLGLDVANPHRPVQIRIILPKETKGSENWEKRHEPIFL